LGCRWRTHGHIHRGRGTKRHRGRQTLGRCSALQGHWEIATNVAKLPNCSIKVDLEMSLTRKQRAELKAIGPELVRQKILETKGVAPGTAVKGFKTASYLHRGDIEDWLIEKQGAGAIVSDTRYWRQSLPPLLVSPWLLLPLGGLRSGPISRSARQAMPASPRFVGACETFPRHLRRVHGDVDFSRPSTASHDAPATIRPN
jgi:hypothetical protein